MDPYTSDFSLAIEGVKGYCPAGEADAKQNIAHASLLRWCSRPPRSSGNLNGSYASCPKVR